MCQCAGATLLHLDELPRAQPMRADGIARLGQFRWRLSDTVTHGKVHRREPEPLRTPVRAIRPALGLPAAPGREARAAYACVVGRSRPTVTSRVQRARQTSSYLRRNCMAAPRQRSGTVALAPLVPIDVAAVTVTASAEASCARLVLVMDLRSPLFDADQIIR